MAPGIGGGLEMSVAEQASLNQRKAHEVLRKSGITGFRKKGAVQSL